MTTPSLNFRDPAKLSMIEAMHTNMWFVEAGVLPEPIREPIVSALEAISKSKKNIDKVCCFYVNYQDPDHIRYWTALSGTGNPDAARELQKRVGRITFIPFAKQVTEIPSSESTDELDRLSLFERFLIVATNNIEKPDHFAKTQMNFKLNEEACNSIKTIRTLLKTISEKKLWPECKDTLSVISRLVRVFLFYRVGDLSCLHNNTGITISRIGKDGSFKEATSLEDLEEFSINPDKTLLEPHVNVEEIQRTFMQLWRSLEEIDNFQFSQKMAHCAENNLTEFLHENPGLLSENGEHYFFSMKVGSKEIVSKCDNCNVNFGTHFSHALGLSGQEPSGTSFVGQIPIMPPSPEEKKEMDQVEEEMNLAREAHVKSKNEELFNKLTAYLKLTEKAEGHQVWKIVNDGPREVVRLFGLKIRAEKDRAYFNRHLKALQLQEGTEFWYRPIADGTSFLEISASAIRNWLLDQ